VTTPKRKTPARKAPVKKAPAKRKPAAKVGRPSTYTKVMPQKAIDYANGGYTKQKRAIPTIEGFALSIGSPTKTLYRWAENHDEFRHALDVIKDTQREILLTSGLVGDFNPTIAKLVLSANHGMNERTEHDLSGQLGVFEIDYTGATHPDSAA
jgi:hypothetical protein